MLHQLISGRGAEELVFPFNADEWRYIFRRILKAAGCKGMTFHDFRRTSAREKRADGIDSSIIVAMQGWKSDAMFRRSGIMNVADQRAALQNRTCTSHVHDGHSATENPAN
jgi:integrase